MLKLTLSITLMLGAACVTVPVPDPPRSLADLEPQESAEARKAAYTEHALAMAKGRTVSLNKSAGFRAGDLSVLEQDGNYYHMWDYLPELQKVGIAEGVKNPHTDIVWASRYLKVMWAMPFAGYLIGKGLCINKPDNRCYDPALLTVLGVFAMPVPAIFGIKAANRARE